MLSTISQVLNRELGDVNNRIFFEQKGLYKRGKRFMVMFLNRKRLLVDMSQVECNRVKVILKSADIEYQYVTAKSAPLSSLQSDVAAGSRYALPYSRNENNITYVYYIYVKRKDYKRAKKLAYS